MALRDQIGKETIKQAVKDAFVRSVTEVPSDVMEALTRAAETETSERGRRYLAILLENARRARAEKAVICLDTGVPTFFVRTPLDFPYRDSLRDAFDEALRELTEGEFPLRSVVVDPFSREDRGGNCAENIPLIHAEIDNGIDYMEITSYPKGSGSGIFGRVEMLPQTAGLAGVKRFVVDTVLRAGTKPCPPVIVGVGVGGPMEEVARLSTMASARPISQRHREPRIAALEKELYEALNLMGIGPMGTGGSTSVLAVNVEYSGTHRPWMPVAVNINCWPGRRAVCRVYRDGRVEPVQA